jgi:plasmid maintenance system antidote protein VapI
MAQAFEPTRLRFGDALADLLRENDYTTSTGNPNWHAFARELDGIHYETLRKAVNGQRGVTPELIEEVARALRIRPQHFVEYRLHEARQVFDPREVGFDQALANVEAWAKAARKRRG